MTRPRTQYLVAGAAVLALHGAIAWLLLSRMRALHTRPIAQSLEIFWVPAPSRPEPVADARPASPRASRPFRRSAPPLPAPQQTPEPGENNAITPPVDWQGELAREAAAGAKPQPDFQDFGFPRPAAPAPRANEFAWDRSRTHRVQSDQGALLVHVNDRCMIVLTPFPFPVCTPGKRAAEGNLFEHMKEALAGASP
jgi:hypothetical protein